MKTKPAFLSFLFRSAALFSHNTARITLAALLAAPSVQAANISWSGATDVAWNTNTNWVGDAVPLSNDSLFFGASGVGGLSLNNDRTNGSFTVASFVFDITAGAYVIGDGTANANAGNTFVLGAPAASAVFVNSITNGSGSLQTINAPFSMTAVRIVIGGADITLTGNISGTSGGFRKSSSNTLTLSGTNTYTGATQIDLGVLRLDSANAVPGGIGATGGLSNINLNGSVLGLAAGDFTRGLGTGVTQVQFGNANPGGGGWAAFGADRIVNLGGASASVNWTTANTGLNSKTLILSHPTATHSIDFQNPLDMLAVARTVQVDEGAAAIDGIISGNITGIAGGNLSKTGNGTLVLSGAVSNYAGTTTVSAGTLLVNGTKSGTGTVTVSAGAALGGTGTINGAVTASTGGRFDLTNGAVGNLSLGSSLTLSGNAATPNHLFFDLGSGASGTDKIITTGAHTAATAAGVQVHLNQLGATTIDPGTYTLIQGGAASNFTGYTLATTRSGRNAYSALGASGNNLQVTVAAGNAGPADPYSYWAGDTSVWNTAQWYSDSGGTTTALPPGFSSNVRFGTTAAANLSNTLGQDYEVNSLTVDAGLAATSISGNMLTIDATADNGNTLGNGITINNADGTSIASKVGLANSQTWTVESAAALTVSGVVSDFGVGHSLTKAGDGLLTLSGVNTFTGPLTVSGGTLAIGGAGQLNGGSYGANIVNNGILSFTGSSNNNLNGIISGSGSLTKSGAGILTLVHSGTFAGGASISDGTLSIGTANLVNPLGVGTTTVNTGGTYALSATLLTAPLVLNGGTVTAGNSFGSAINGPMTLDANSTISISGNLSINSNITGTGGLTKTLGAFVPLNGSNNDYSGPTVISAGGLTIKSSLYGNDTAKWIPDNITVNSGGALIMRVGGPGEFSIAQAGTMFSQLGGTVNNNGLKAGSFFGVDTGTSGGTSFLISDNLVDSSGPGGGSVGFQFFGNGVLGGSILELTGTNTYSGRTIIERQGILKVSSINSVATNPLLGTVQSPSSSLGAPTTVANGTISLGTGATFQGAGLIYTGTGETTDRVLALGGGGLTSDNYRLDQSGTGLLKFISNMTTPDTRGPKNITLQGSTTGTGEISGVIPNATTATPTTAITKSGTGTWTLSAANLYAGVTTLTDGVLSVATVSDGGFSGLVTTTTANNATVTLTTGTTASLAVGMTAVSSSIPAGRTIASIVNSTTFTLNDGNGVTAATGRALNAGMPSNLGIAPSAAANLVFNGGTLQYTGATASTNRSFTINAGTVATFDITANNLTITGASTNTNGRLTKTGAGTLTLNGTNLHTGITTVSAGTLSLGSSGSVAGSTSVAIAAGATFDTSGQAIYAIPTGKPVAFGIDSTGSGSSGKINAAQLNIANATVTYNFTGTPDDPVYVLATYTTLTGGTFLSAPAPPTGYTLNYAYQGNKIALVSTGTPYDTWAAGTFANPFTNTGKEVDFDNDGLSNLLEFVLGGDPTISQAGIAPSVSTSGSNLVLTFKRSDVSELAPAVTVKVELSSDLTFSTPAQDITIGPVTDAGPIAPSGASYTVSNSGGLDTITVTIPQGTDPKKFARVRAIAP